MMPPTVKNTWLFTSCEILLMSKYIQNVELELCLCYHRYIHFGLSIIVNYLSIHTVL